MKTVAGFVIPFLFVFVMAIPAFAASDDGVTGPSEEEFENSLDSMLNKPAEPAAEPATEPAEEPKAEPAAPEAKAEPVVQAEPEKAPEPKFPPDSRKIKVSIKLKDKKIWKGTVINFLTAPNLTDHGAEPQWEISEGLMVTYDRNEFFVPWEEIKTIEFNKKNRENGEKNCYEVSDASPDRVECLMINQYVLYTKKKGQKARHIIESKDFFRFVVKTYKGEMNFDTHLGKIRVTNERDEEIIDRDALLKDMDEQYKKAVYSISFQ